MLGLGAFGERIADESPTSEVRCCATCLDRFIAPGTAKGGRPDLERIDRPSGAPHNVAPRS